MNIDWFFIKLLCKNSQYKSSFTSFLLSSSKIKGSQNCQLISTNINQSHLFVILISEGLHKIASYFSEFISFIFFGISTTLGLLVQTSIKYSFQSAKTIIQE